MKNGKIEVGNFFYEDGFFWNGVTFVWDGCDEGIRTSEFQYEGYQDNDKKEDILDIIGFN